MKKILFPFEIGNPIYKEAYVYAVKLARNLYKEMILLNTFVIESVGNITESQYGKLIRDNWFRAYNDISKFNKYFLESHARIDDELKIKFDYRFIHGLFMDEIRKIASEEEVGMIVLPVSDRKELNKRQLEIIRDNIYEKNRVSLLVIPASITFRPIVNIVFSADLKKLNHFSSYLEEVIHLSRAFDARIHFVHVSTKAEDESHLETEAYEKVKQVVEKNSKHQFKWIIGKDVVSTVNQYVEENNIDLLVVVKHQHFFLDTLFHRSVSNEISLNSNVPVLVMREEVNT